MGVERALCKRGRSGRDEVYLHSVYYIYIFKTPSTRRLLI